MNFIKWLQTLANETDSRIIRLKDGEKYKARSKKYVKVDENIGKALDDYENWLEETGEMPFEQFVYATNYVLSLLSYQLCEINEVGIPSKEAKVCDYLEEF